MALENLRYGIIGTGMMGIEHQRNLAALRGATVTALADPHQPSLDRAVAEVGGSEAQTFLDYRELLASDHVDAVIIASPNMTHIDVAADAIRSGLHVMIEKPLATTVDDCLTLMELPQRANQVVAVGLEYRYMPPVAALIDVVRSGQLGEPKMVAITEHRFPFLVKVNDWNRFNENTGGTLVEKCCHFFDLMSVLTKSEPVTVMASGAMDVNHIDERYDGRTPDILDNAFVIVEFANGMRASLDLCMFAEGSVDQEAISVVGTLGKAEAFLPSSKLRIGARTGWHQGVTEQVVEDPSIGHEGFHHGASYVEHVHFAEAIRTGGEPAIGLADGLRSVAVGVAAHRSIDEGRVVHLGEVLGGNLS